jgi:MoxR-like ATPase
VKFGASPRAALSLAAACKARALLQGRPNASFEDARALAPAVLRHRIILDYQARVEGKSTNSVIAALLKEIPFDSTPLPRTLQPASG